MLRSFVLVYITFEHSQAAQYLSLSHVCVCAWNENGIWHMEEWNCVHIVSVNISLVNTIFDQSYGNLRKASTCLLLCGGSKNIVCLFISFVNLQIETIAKPKKGGVKACHIEWNSKKDRRIAHRKMCQITLGKNGRNSTHNNDKNLWSQKYSRNVQKTIEYKRNNRQFFGRNASYTLQHTWKSAACHKGKILVILVEMGEI